MYRFGLGLRLGLEPGNGFVPVLFFPTLKSDEHLMQCYLWQCSVRAM